MPWLDCLDVAVSWLGAAYPDEGCGLIVRANERFEFVPCANLAPPALARAHYVLDPLEFIAAENRGAEVAVLVHSHVDASDGFSATDVASALMPDGAPAYPGVDYLVVSIRAGRPHHASLFRFDAASQRFSRVWSRRFAD